MGSSTQIEQNHLKYLLESLLVSLIHWQMWLLILQCFNLTNNLWCGPLSNAMAKSRRMTSVCLCWFRACKRFSISKMSCVTQEYNAKIWVLYFNLFYRTIVSSLMFYHYVPVGQHNYDFEFTFCVCVCLYVSVCVLPHG